MAHLLSTLCSDEPFLYSTVSPLQIHSRDLHACRECAGHECINGRRDGRGHLVQQGCQLELYVPTVRSNLDCTLCLDCAKACPYDNVALSARQPGEELLRRTWPRRLDLALLAVMAAFAGLINAFAMTPPVYTLEQWLAGLLNTRQEWIVLGLIFLTGVVLAPPMLIWAAAWLSRRLAGSDQNWREQILRYAYAFVPMGLAIWMAHYGFHFLIGSMTIVPALQNFFASTLGWPVLGQPDWQLAGRFIPPLVAVQAFQVIAVGAGWAAAATVAFRAVRRSDQASSQPLLAALPWLLVLLLMAVAAIYIFLLPMEMRGSVLGG